MRNIRILRIDVAFASGRLVPSDSPSELAEYFDHEPELYLGMDLQVEVDGQSRTWTTTGGTSWNWIALGNEPLEGESIKPAADMPAIWMDQPDNRTFAELFTALASGPARMIIRQKRADFRRMGSLASEHFAVLTLSHGELGCLAAGSISLWRAHAAGNLYESLFPEPLYGGGGPC